MKRLLTLAILSLGSLNPEVVAEEVFIRSLPAEPNTCYRLTFQAPTSSQRATGTQNAIWLLRTFNLQGEFPYDGSFERDWQQIVPGKTHYSHAFRTPPDTTGVWFGVRYDGSRPQISHVKLESITPENLIINGDFAAGQGDYSGWTEHFNTVFVEVDGQPALKIEHNGYALTDRVPVEGGGEYRYETGSTTATSILAYDTGMHLIEAIPYHHKSPVIKMPERAAYVRLLYQTWFDHIPAYRTKTITSVGLRQTESTKREHRSANQRFPAELILDANCDAREEHAARELQHWIAEITGKRIPTLSAASESQNTKIFLGSKWAKQYPDDLQYLAGSDGYAVRRSGNSIHVFGANPRGTLFGTYALLEKNTDIIWPRPNSEFIAVYSKNPNITFSATDFRSRPAFSVRQINIMGSDHNPVQTQEWIGRNGGNTPMMLGKGFQYLRWRSGAMLGDGGGYIWTFMGLEQAAEVYPLVNGNRLRNMWRQPCYTHPDVPKIMADTARKMLASVPGKKLEFLIARVGDNWEVCGCANCMAPITLDDGTLLEPKASTSGKDPLFFSTRNYMMLNKFAEELVQDYPDLKIHTHAYIFAAEPPKVRLHPAIVPHFAAYPTKDERYPILNQPTKRGEIWGQRFKQWGREQKVQFGFFGYYYTSGFNALADTAAQDYQALCKMRGLHTHTEGFPGDTDELNNWDVDGPEKWVIAKLQWDPDQDPAALRDQYITRTYQDAAPKMREFYHLINASWHDATNETSVNCHASAKNLFQKFIVEPRLEKPARELLVAAEQVASHPKSRKMIQRTLARFDSYAESLNRLIVPLVPESTEQWNDHTSPHWYKALSIGDFTRVTTWQPLPEDRSAKHGTTVSIMRDRENLYFKIDAAGNNATPSQPAVRSAAFPRDDRVEIVLRSGSNTFYFAVGVDGGTYLLKNWNTATPWKSNMQATFHTHDRKWMALLAVPFDDLELDPERIDLDGKFCRVFAPHSPDREESTYNGRGIFYDHQLLRNPLQFEK